MSHPAVTGRARRVQGRECSACGGRLSALRGLNVIYTPRLDVLDVTMSVNYMPITSARCFLVLLYI